jgi:glycosyltransferase involved in cell wall biosynthesis
VPNGFDTLRLHPDPAAGARLRATLGIPETAFIIGHVARLDPMKDHATFLAAASLVATAQDRARFVIVGKDTESLAPDVARYGLSQKVHLLGERDDIASLMPGFDLFCLSSAFGEGFPTVLGEALACGVPCVSTDVGDAARIVDSCGRIVPPGQAAALAAALIEMATLAPESLAALRRTSRQRIETTFSLAHIVQRYEQIYDGVGGPA